MFKYIICFIPQYLKLVLYDTDTDTDTDKDLF